MFAIVETAGSQHKVSQGTILELNRLEGKEGDEITLDKVLLISDNGNTKVGAPYLSGASAKAKILEHKRGEKITVFKMKAKKRYQKTQGHRQELTTVEITSIKG